MLSAFSDCIPSVEDGNHALFPSRSPAPRGFEGFFLRLSMVQQREPDLTTLNKGGLRRLRV